MTARQIWKRMFRASRIGKKHDAISPLYMEVALIERDRMREAMKPFFETLFEAWCKSEGIVVPAGTVVKFESITGVTHA